MSAGFTPGPWTPVFGNAHPSVKGLRWVEVEPPTGFSVHRDYSTEANAKLIAAAPEMFDALTSLLSWIRSGDIDGSVSVLKAVDALAKARGEQSNA